MPTNNTLYTILYGSAQFEMVSQKDRLSQEFVAFVRDGLKMDRA